MSLGWTILLGVGIFMWAKAQEAGVHTEQEKKRLEAEERQAAIRETAQAKREGFNPYPPAPPEGWHSRVRR